MEFISGEVRTFVYTLICIQCLLQLKTGSAYQKYLRLFSCLLSLSMCCGILFSIIKQIDISWERADAIYQEFEKTLIAAEDDFLYQVEEESSLIEETIYQNTEAELTCHIQEIIKTELNNDYAVKETKQDERGIWCIYLMKQEKAESGQIEIKVESILTMADKQEGERKQELEELFCQRLSFSRENMEVYLE